MYWGNIINNFNFVYREDSHIVLELLFNAKKAVLKLMLLLDNTIK